MELNNESKTLFIPLYAKALMSKQKLFISDIKAEEIINSVDFNFEKLKQTKWLSMYLAVRAKVIDEICIKFLSNNTNAVVVHLGCGLDSRCLRIGKCAAHWYDIDFESVIDLRKNFYAENRSYKMIGKSVIDLDWLDEIKVDDRPVLIVAEGLTMYLTENEIKQLLAAIKSKFGSATIVFDAYSKKAVKLSKIKNPVKQMNASIKWGMDNIEDFTKLNNNLEFVKEHLIKHDEPNLKKVTKYIFENIYCGKMSETLYKIYEFRFK